MQNKSIVFDNIISNLAELRNIEEQNSNITEARLYELEKKNCIIIKHLKNMLMDLENNNAE